MRIRYALAAFAAVTLSGVLAGCAAQVAPLAPGAAEGTGSPAATATDGPSAAASPTATSPGPVASSAAAPAAQPRACAGADLADHAVLLMHNGAGGTQYTYVTVARRGSGACVLDGAPEVAMVASDGTRQVLTTSGGLLRPPAVPPAVVPEGGTAQVAVLTGESCDGGVGSVTYDNVVLIWGGQVIALPGVTLQTTCGVAATDWTPADHVAAGSS